jgi:pimeloyl-ACP methyl ester carboxylesterase
MNPFFFGSSNRPLLGVYHPPRGGVRASRGVVLCYPIGPEYMRAHRAFRQLTTLLTKRGVHVLRFDYYGTGDSGGGGEDGSVAQWLDDIDGAIEELKATTGLPRVSLAGLRFGGTLAALAARRRGDIDALVLWDPVVDGRSYVLEMLHPVGRAAGEAGSAAPSDLDFGLSRSTFADSLETVGVGGFPLTGGMRRDISAIDLAEGSGVAARSFHLIVSREHLHYFRLRDRWRALNLPQRYECIPSDGNWAEGDVFGSALIPQEIIQGVVRCLT